MTPGLWWLRQEDSKETMGKPSLVTYRRNVNTATKMTQNQSGRQATLRNAHKMQRSRCQVGPVHRQPGLGRT